MRWWIGVQVRGLDQKSQVSHVRKVQGERLGKGQVRVRSKDRSEVWSEFAGLWPLIRGNRYDQRSNVSSR